MLAKPYPETERGLLPEKRVKAKYPFAVTGIDFVGPFHLKEGREGSKGYVLVFSCATTRAVYFTVTRTMESKEFNDKLNEFISVHS